MQILCGGILDGSNSVWSQTLSIDCLDSSPCGAVAGQMLQSVLVGSSSASLNSCRHVAYAPFSLMKHQIIGSSSFSSFSPEITKQILIESEEYVKNQDKLCTSAAFVFHRIPPVNGSGGNATAIGSGGGMVTVAVNSNENNTNNNNEPSLTTSPAGIVVDRIITLWLFCHIDPELGSTINAPSRILDLTNAATILARWSEMCLREANFCKFVKNDVKASGSAGIVRKWPENTLAFAATCLDECAGEFGDARHACLELRLAE
jgi:hypothetical protein